MDYFARENKMKKGLIALDIDGTLTADITHIPTKVTSYLEKLHLDGWEILVITGRSYSFARQILRDLHFPFYLAVQNGADLVSMPGAKPLLSNYLNREMLASLQELCKGYGQEFLLYAGQEQGDFCYYRKSAFSEDLHPILEKWAKLVPSQWKEIADINTITQKSFPLVKLLGSSAKLTPIFNALASWQEIERVMIRDPTHEDLQLLMVTHCDVNKGKTVSWLHRQLQLDGKKIIAAGDDFNDESMFKVATFAIVMGDAPEPLKSYAHFIARPASELGIIEALGVATSS